VDLQHPLRPQRANTRGRKGKDEDEEDEEEGDIETVPLPLPLLLLSPVLWVEWAATASSSHARTSLTLLWCTVPCRVATLVGRYLSTQLWWRCGVAREEASAVLVAEVELEAEVVKVSRVAPLLDPAPRPTLPPDLWCLDDDEAVPMGAAKTSLSVREPLDRNSSMF
jgi:hypothetical protein